MFEVNNKNTKRRHWRFYCLLLTYFTPFSTVFIAYFEQINVSLEATFSTEK